MKVHSASRSWGTVMALALLLGLSIVPDAAAQQNPGFRVVVHASNPVSSLTGEEVARLFEKRTTRWENGQAVLPVDLPENAPARVRFTRAVHGKAVSAIKAHWQRQIFSGRAVPPIERPSDADVLTYIAANENAIGYVSSDTPIPANLKVLEIS